VTSEDRQNAMQPRHQGVPQAGRQEGRKEAGQQFEDGEETPNGGATWPHVAAVPAAVADPGLSPRSGQRRREPADRDRGRRR